MLEVGSKAPEFSLPDQNGQVHNLSDYRGQRVILSFEGVRQTCYLYVNGSLAGYYEMGVGPFGFDITPWLAADGRNAIAIATEVTILDPVCVVLGGGVVRMPGFPLDELERRVKENLRIPDPRASLRLVLSSGDPEAGVVGAVINAVSLGR